MIIYDGRESFYQWDLNQKITSTAFKVGDEIHFFNMRQPNALVVKAYELDGKVVADVPNILLQRSLPISVYRYIEDDNGSRTIEEYHFDVKQRSKPDDYVYTETEVWTYRKLEERIIALEEGGVGGGGLTEDEVKEIVNTETEGKFTPETYGLPNYNGDGYIPVLKNDYKSYGKRFVSVWGIDYSVAGRGSNGTLAVGDATADHHATTFKQLKEYTAPIPDHEKRIENLESTLLTFIEDTSIAYEKDVPVGVGENAVLSSIGGATKTSKNLLAPETIKATDIVVNDDGSVTYDAYAGQGWSFEIVLDKGIYLIDAIDAYLGAGGVSIDGIQIGFGYPCYITIENDNTLVRADQYDTGGIDQFGITSKFQVSKVEYEGEVVPWEPYGVSAYAKVTAVESYGSNLFNIDGLKGFTDSVNVTVDFDNKTINCVGTAAHIAKFTTTEAFFNAFNINKVGTYRFAANAHFDMYIYKSGKSILDVNPWQKPFEVTQEFLDEANNLEGGYYITVYVIGKQGESYGDIRITRSTDVLPYHPYASEPIDTFTISSEIQAINGFGKDGFMLDFESKTTEYEGETTDVSQYLTGYDKFKTIKVQGGGKVRFVSESKLPVPSEITYVKAKE